MNFTNTNQADGQISNRVNNNSFKQAPPPAKPYYNSKAGCRIQALARLFTAYSQNLPLHSGCKN